MVGSSAAYQNPQMKFRAGLLATATAGAFLLTACGGGDQSNLGSAGAGTQSQPVNAGGSVDCSNVAAHRSGSGSSARYVAILLTSSGHALTQGRGAADGEKVGTGFQSHNSGTTHALLWKDSASNAVNLHPNGFRDSAAVAASGGQQAGWGFTLSGRTHALKWSGSASSVVDLDPTGDSSAAHGISGDQVVGHRTLQDGPHASLWTSRGVVDLQPSGFKVTIARATDGTQQVGDGYAGDGTRHALLWNGTAESFVDLHPAGYSRSEAYGVSCGQQVGNGSISSEGHALLWTGSAQSVVNLHAGGFSHTAAYAVTAGRQAGIGVMPGTNFSHALLWHGSADSMVDLHKLLPAHFYHSLALGIDASGNVTGLALSPGCGSGCDHAILWVRQ